MTRKEILLTLLSEECIETAHRVSKAIRFTLDEVQPGQDLNNSQRILYEFNDIVAVMEVLKDEGIFSNLLDREMIDKKKEKIFKYLNYSQKVGALIQ